MALCKPIFTYTGTTIFMAQSFSRYFLRPRQASSAHMVSITVYLSKVRTSTKTSSFALLLLVITLLSALATSTSYSSVI